MSAPAPLGHCACAHPAREREGCACKRDRTLDVLRKVQQAYEAKLDAVETSGAHNKAELTVSLLRSWVGDLVSQNTLLAEAVHQLELDATSRLLAERRRHDEVARELRTEVGVLRRRLVRKDSDLRGLVEVLRRLREFDYCTLDGIHFFEAKKEARTGGHQEEQSQTEHKQDESSTYARGERPDKVNDLNTLNETLQNEISVKDREIKYLIKEIKELEQSILNFRSEINNCKNHKPVKVCQKDAEVMAEFGIDREEPVKQGASQVELDECREKMNQMEAILKRSGESVLSLREVNVALSEETHALRRVCAALDQQCRTETTKAQFKDDIIREMRRQLKQYKTKVETPATSTPPACFAKDNTFPRDLPFIPRSTPSPLRELLESTAPPGGRRRHYIRPRGYDTDYSNVSTLPVEELFFNKEATGQSYKDGGPYSGRCNTDEETQTFEKAIACACDMPEIKTHDNWSQFEPFLELPSSGRASSGAASVATSARTAEHYRDKLLATLEILKNAEETIRVQSASLCEAESRIAKLTERTTRLQQDLYYTRDQMRELQKLVECQPPRITETTDVYVHADIQELENQKKMVKTLQSNLSVIEELYRECFYETAKQEQLIEMLRESFLDVRLADTEKTHTISRLQNVIRSQKWSHDQCQDLAVEVENLKSEISNFLNNSNNDSGMWCSEESSQSEVGEELQEISHQLLMLQAMLVGECTCGLDEENSALKCTNDTLDQEVINLRQREAELHAIIQEKDKWLKEYKRQLDLRQEETQCCKQTLMETVAGLKNELRKKHEELQQQKVQCECLQTKLITADQMKKEKSAQLEHQQDQCRVYEDTIQELREELDKRDITIKKEAAARSDESLLRQQLDESAAKVNYLEEKLGAAERAYRNLEICYRSKAEEASQLESQLEEATTRGAELCGESRCVLSCVRGWITKMRGHHREQQKKIETQDSMISKLQQSLKELERDRDDRLIRERAKASCSKYVRERRDAIVATEESGLARVPPVPLRKKYACGCRRRVASVQQPHRQDKGTEYTSGQRTRKHSLACAVGHEGEASSVSPRPWDLVERLEALQDGFLSAQARWSRSNTRAGTHERT